MLFDEGYDGVGIVFMIVLFGCSGWRYWYFVEVLSDEEIVKSLWYCICISG